jgi:deazaflavin-dependent oxidoreductase (nitroreductase family)
MRVVRPFANRVFNPLVRPFVAWIPGFALVVHRGRRTGRLHRTPMMVFRRGEDAVFALTYGRDVDWVRNVLAAGWCELIVRRGRLRLVEPRVVTDRTRRLVPALVRLPLRALGVDDFLVMRRA